MSITLIGAMDRNRAIGIENKLPWRLPAEMAYFTKVTTGKTVLMGRKTFESLPKPLKDRKNVILTRQQHFHPEGCEVVHSIEKALELYKSDELMIMGGSEIYTQFLPYADTILLTAVEVELAVADAYFPKFSDTEWKLVDSIDRQCDEKNVYNFTFLTYKRIRKDEISG